MHACNAVTKESAWPFRECELFKIDDLGTFYLDSIAGEPSRALPTGRAGLLERAERALRRGRGDVAR